MDNIYFFIFIIVLIIFCFYYPNPKIFHHSRINTKYDYNNYPQPNLLKFPLYYFINPIMIELFPGETLYIPKRWWHWVFSKGENIAINQWFYKKVSKKPFKFKNSKFESKKKILITEIKDTYFNEGIGIGQNNPNIYSFKRTFDPYDKDDDKIFFKGKLKDFLKVSFSKKYTGYMSKGKIPKQYMKLLPRIKESKICNIWYYSNDVNSGLHYDKFDNYLTQLKGTKKIYLYPPKYSKYLYADKILPFNDKI